MGFVTRFIPMGGIGIVLILLMLNTVWTMGLAIGVNAYENDSVSVSEEQSRILSEKQIVTSNVYANVTSDQEHQFQLFIGIPLDRMIEYMFMYTIGGVRFGYHYPAVSVVLIKYLLPVVVPVGSLLVLKYKQIERVVGVLRR